MTTLDRLTDTVTLTVTLTEPNEGISGLLDTARHVSNEANRLRAAFDETTVDGLVDPTVIPEGTKKHEVYLLGRTEKTGLLTAGVDYGSGPFVFFLTDCCGASATYHDSDLCCKACWHDVPYELDGEYSPRAHGAILPPTEADKATFKKSAA